MGWLEHIIPPPFVMLAFALVMGAVHYFAGGHLVFGLLFYLGLALMAAGFALAFTGLRSLIANRTTPSPINIERAKKLVTSGLYNFTRNPMYLGMVVFLIGVALLLANGWLLIGPALFAIFITRFQIVPEERVMTTKFGADYTAYQHRVRRWI